jgi:hypothetical protein
MSRSPMDALEDALIDLETSSTALDDVIAHLPHDCGVDWSGCVASLHRLIVKDIVALRAAYKKLHDNKRPKAPSPSGRQCLSVVSGGGEG